MNNNAEKHRDRIRKILKDNTFPHQKFAAKKTFSGFDPETRTIILAAEMQSGKSGVALALACYQRESMSEEDICNQALLKDTMYVLTMPDTSLLAQAKDDLKVAHNVIVSNLNYFSKDIEQSFNGRQPELIVVDECHYGSSDRAVRYEALFEHIEKHNPDCKVVFLSATPLSALVAAESEFTLRRNLKTKLVFHKASEDYLGIRQFDELGNVRALNGRTKNFLNRSKEREQFIDHLISHDEAGWALLRVPNGYAMEAKNLLSKLGLDRDNISIIGSSLAGVPRDELVTVEQFKDKFDQGVLFGKKMVAITVAGVRAGINFGPTMKESLIATWDSTVSSVAAIVQANIGRACGYHDNRTALHFTNRHGVRAYSDIVNFLEKNCVTQATDDLKGLRSEFERICTAYDIKALDVGARVNKSNGVSRSSIENDIVFDTDSYLIVPGMLGVQSPSYTDFTDDPEYLSAIETIRKVYQRSGLEPKGNRSLPQKSTYIASWVNGDTFENEEKAVAGGPAFRRVTKLLFSLDNDQVISFGEIVPAGGGIDLSKKTLAIYIFSIFNKSNRKVEKTTMNMEDMTEVCNAYDIPVDDTVLVLFKKGEVNDTLTELYREEIERKVSASKIREKSKFMRH